MRRPRAVQAGFVWGSFDQVLSSATNFALSVAAGRILGPAGLGIVFVGFSAYLVALGFQRALVLNPLVIVASEPGTESTRAATSRGLTLAAGGAAVWSMCLFVAGWLVPGDIGYGLRIVAPWIVPAVVQDFWRTVLFRDRREPAATANDGAWALALVVGTPLLVAGHSPGVVVAWWGLGASTGALAGFFQLRLAPSSLADSWSWWREHAALGGWLWLASLVFYVAAQGVVLELAATLGAKDLGGLRAVDSVLTPLSVLRPAAELPGLPAVSTALRRSRSEAWSLALRISLGVAALVVLYLVVMVSVARPVLTRVFGGEFAGFERLIVPLGVAQVASALAVGAMILLKASRRARALAASSAVGGVATLAVVGPVAASSGLLAATWGLAAGTALAAALTIAVAWPGRRAPVAAQA